MPENVTDAKRAKILNQVRVMLDIADRDTTPPGEAAAARAKAEQFMRDYRIEEEAALAVDPTSLKPEMRIVQLAPRRSEFSQQYLGIFREISRSVGIRARYTYAGGFLIAQAVGYAFDLDAAELLFTSARLVFSGHLEPAKDASLSEAENVYRLRRSGMERWRVAQIMWGSNVKDGAAHGKVAKIYKAECERRGEVAALSGRSVSADVYRAAYAKGFVDRFARRLYLAQQGADKTGGSVQLHGRQERVDEEFYTRFPEYRPVPGTEVAQLSETEPCIRCKKAASGTCRQHKAPGWTKADEARYVRQNESLSARAGLGAGSAAANAVKLSGEGQTIHKLDDRTGGGHAVQGVLGN